MESTIVFSSSGSSEATWSGPGRDLSRVKCFDDRSPEGSRGNRDLNSPGVVGIARAHTERGPESGHSEEIDVGERVGYSVLQCSREILDRS